MSILSNLAESLVGSEIVKLGNAINDRKAKGEKIYNYTIGDFDPKIFPIPALLESEIIKAYQSHKTNYPPADGILQLRESISNLFKRTIGITYATDEILVASGGRPLIYSLFKTLVNKGDKVIYTVPSWNNNHYVSMNEGTHCVVDVYPEDNFMPTAASLQPHLKDAVLLCLCTPQNPTGTTLPMEELKQICNLILEENNRRGSEERKLYLMFDQMYWTLTYGSTIHYNPVQLVPAMKDYTIFVDGISKSFAATGVRVGWSMGPKKVIAKMKALLSHIGAWAPMAEQYATSVFLNNEIEVNTFSKSFKHAIEQRLNRVYDGFNQLKNKGYPIEIIAPQAAIYATVKIDLKGYDYKGEKLNTQKQVSDFLLDVAHLAIVPFNCFGADENEPWYRISVGTCTMEDLDEMFQELTSAIQLLQSQ